MLHAEVIEHVYPTRPPEISLEVCVSQFERRRDACDLG